MKIYILIYNLLHCQETITPFTFCPESTQIEISGITF